MIKLRCVSIAKNSAKFLTEFRRVLSSDSKPEGWELAKPFKSVPGPRALPILGNTWRYFIGPLKSMDYLVIHKLLNSEYGDICIMSKQIGLPDMVFVYDPGNIEKLLRNEGKWPERDSFMSTTYYRNVIRKEIFGEQRGLLNSRGETWHDMRSKVNPIFMQPRTAKLYIGSMNTVASDFLEKIRLFASQNENGEMPEDFQNEINKWAFESIGVIALDRRLGCLDKNPNEEAETMVRYMSEIFKMMIIIDFTPIGQYLVRFNMPMWKKFVRYQDFFTNMALKFLNEAEEKINSSSTFNEKPENERSVFEKLLKVDKKLAMVMTLDMLSAGIDTTGKTTAAALYYLAKNPDVQRKLREELLGVMPDPDTPLTSDILNNVPYLKAVVKEVGRVAPIGAGHMRKTTKDLVLCGYQIPTGTTMIIPTLFLSNGEKYFNRPKEFLPERWLKATSGELSYKNVNPFITLPFGYGPRGCIGQRFANLEMEIMIAKIIRNFTLTWPHPDMRFGQDLLYGIKDPLKLHVQTIH